MSDDNGPGVLNITPGMRRHLNVVKGQRMYQDEGRWFVWRRIAQPPYTDGADRFRWWKPRHLAAAVAQWRWARRYWGRA